MFSRKIKFSNKEKRRIKFESIEEEVLFKMSQYISKKYMANCEIVTLKGNSYMYINNEKFDLLLTVCDTDNKKCIKIEEIQVEEEFRNKKIATNLIETMKTIVDLEKVTLGLWCEIDNKILFNFYSRLGFKYIETLRDDWLEYN